MPITQALSTDIPALTRLVNNAYRDSSKKGWTSEADIIEGSRIDEDMLSTYFANEAVTILKYTNELGELTGSVYLEVKGPVLYLGMLSVSPSEQGGGIGRQLLADAAVFAVEHGCHKISMTVIRARKELVSWYERHGYNFTGEILPFHDDGRFGTPKTLIELMVLEKAV